MNIPDVPILCLFAQDFLCNGPVQKKFKAEYDSVPWLLAQNKLIGDVIPVFIDERYVYYGIVKKHTYTIALIEDVREVLNKVVIHAAANNIPNVSIPLNCYSELSEESIKTQTVQAFANSNIDYLFYSLY